MTTLERMSLVATERPPRETLRPLGHPTGAVGARFAALVAELGEGGVAERFGIRRRTVRLWLANPDAMSAAVRDRVLVVDPDPMPDGPARPRRRSLVGRALHFPAKVVTPQRGAKDAPVPEPGGGASIGLVVRWARLRRGWSQAQMADASGVGRCTVMDAERGTCRPSATTLRKLAAGLGRDDAAFGRLMELARMVETLDPKERKWRSSHPLKRRSALEKENTAQTRRSGV